MSTLHGANWGDGTNTIPAGALLSTAISWAAVEEDAPQTLASFNLSSFTDNSAGNFTMTFINNHNAAQYGIAMGTEQIAPSNEPDYWFESQTASSFIYRTAPVASSTPTDVNNATFQTRGELA